MKFLVTAFGEEYVPFLTVCIDSIRTTHPADKIVMAWDDIPDRELILLQHHFGSIVEFKQLRLHEAKNDFHQLISMKMRFWKELITAEPHDEIVCLLDCDTLVYKNIKEYTRDDFDLLYTWKAEKYPINTGVIIARVSDKVKKFFELWEQETEKIIGSEELLLKARETFGGGDQLALANLLNTKTFDQDSVRDFAGVSIKFKAVACSELNQTNSVPINSGAKIFHYKGGWHPILLREEAFSENRPIETSYEMYTYWLNRYADIHEKMIHDFIFTACEENEATLDWAHLDYEHRGVPHSEMLAIISVIKKLGIELVIESGRCRGQSTSVLAEALNDTKVKIVSIEWLRDENAEFSEKRLQGYTNLELLYGDANEVVPQVLSQNSQKKTAILFDGPKGRAAYEIFSKALQENNSICVGFFHDVNMLHRRRISNSRIDIINSFDRIFFSDDKKFVERYSSLDEKYYTPESEVDVYSWRPFYKGWDMMGSYGPTIGIVFPTFRDKIRYQHKHAMNNSIQSVRAHNSNLASKLKALLPRSVKQRIKRMLNSEPEVQNEKAFKRATNVPKPLMQLIDNYSKSKPQINFVEVGANDGVSADLIHEYVVRDNWAGILVEPVKFVFDRLVKNYNANHNLKFENSAISDINGVREFYSLRKTDDKLPEFYDRLGSFVKEVLLYHKHAIPDIEKYIVTEQVKCITFSSLLKKHNLDALDVVAIDTEGYDFEVIKLIDFSFLKPEVIIFENKHLKPRDYAECIQYLETSGFDVFEEGGNSIAMKKPLINILIN